jgi:hypothetical protein
VVRRSSAKPAVSSVSESGVMTAPPMPSTARAAISVPTVGASAPAAELTVKRTTPAMNTLRLP